MDLQTVPSLHLSLQAWDRRIYRRLLDVLVLRRLDAAAKTLRVLRRATEEAKLREAIGVMRVRRERARAVRRRNMVVMVCAWMVVLQVCDDMTGERLARREVTLGWFWWFSLKVVCLSNGPLRAVTADAHENG